MTKNSSLFLLLMAFCFWGCSQDDHRVSSGTWDETETTALAGAVEDSLGRPLASARVRLIPSESMDSIRETLSDEKGHFAFDSISGDSMHIEVTYRNSLGAMQTLIFNSTTAPEHSVKMNIRAFPLARFSGCLADSLSSSAKAVLVAETRETIPVAGGCWASTLIPSGVYTFYTVNALGDPLENLSQAGSADTLKPSTLTTVSKIGTHVEGALSLTLAIPADSLKKFIANVDSSWFVLTADSMDTLRISYNAAMDSTIVPTVTLPVNDSIQIIFYTLDSSGTLYYKDSLVVCYPAGERTLTMPLNLVSNLKISVPSDSIATFNANVDSAWFVITGNAIDTIRVAYKPASGSSPMVSIPESAKDSLRISLYTLDSSGNAYYKTASATIAPFSGRRNVEMNLVLSPTLLLAVPSDSLAHFRANVDTAWYALILNSKDTMIVGYNAASAIAKEIPLSGTDSIKVILYARDSAGALYYKSMSSIGPFSGRKTVNMSLTLSTPFTVMPTAAESNDTYIRFGYDSGSAGPVQVAYSKAQGGQKTLLNMGTYDWNTILRSLLYFNLSGADTTYPVRKAYLRLYISYWTNKNKAVNFPYSVHTVLKSWNEGYSTPGGDLNDADINVDSTGVTALYRSIGVYWNRLGLALDDKDASASPLDTGSIKAGVTGVVYLDVTNFARYQLAHQDSVYGMLLRYTNEYVEIIDQPCIYSAEGALAAVNADTLSDDSGYPAIILEY
jgi:hypothetical protein